jgi:peptide chain release factor 2
LLKEKASKQYLVDSINTISALLADAQTLLELYAEEDDASLITELEALMPTIGQKLKQIQLQTMLSGKADANDCYLQINAGAGGVDAQDWAEMLLRMYLRFSEAHATFQAQIIDQSAGDEAGIKSTTIKISGAYAYGWLKGESGVHRLVRVSPFDSNARRHTGFASVWVYPVVEDNIAIEIADKDLRIDTYRASGAGGQHVNRTDSAVRITHTPTNIVVQCQSDRSQHRNKATAMNMLKARLYELELQKQQAEKQQTEASKTEIGWGNQIRSYIMHPYQMVKDHRFNLQSAQVQAVLDGDLAMFLVKAIESKGAAKPL